MTEAHPNLPSRVTINEFKPFGLVNLIRTDRRKGVPWVKPGKYVLYNWPREYTWPREYLITIYPGIKGRMQGVWVEERAEK